VHDHRVLLAVVLGVGEQERQQLVPAERLQRPEERRDAGVAARHVRHRRRCAAAGRGEEGHARERAHREAHAAVAGGLPVVEPDVGPIQPEQVLALDVEDERLRVDGLRPEHARFEEGVEQERRVARLRGDARDPADVDVRAPGAVEEVEVEVERLVVPREAGREAPLHAVEEQRLGPLDPGRPPHRRPG
jgi:hypothetical protein